MFHIVLFEPEIPPNTGNIIRLSANTGASLHLIHPLGFKIEDKQLRRAGLDYREFTNIMEHDCFDDYIKKQNPNTIYAASTKGKVSYSSVNYCSGDSIIFGPESRGLPKNILDYIGENHVLKIPMQRNSRSLNLSNAVAVIIFEALRQNNFSYDM
ncbi:MAG: tRNA (cytidine/uridine-2'-O-)-methyltransferase [Gammaproteobacteria bacterium]|jgi:tRNA (cytidine/uridine-2'-O-)-methyltransferase